MGRGLSLIAACVDCTYTLLREPSTQGPSVSKGASEPSIPRRPLVLGGRWDGVMIRVLQTYRTSRMCNYISLHVYISLFPHRYLSSLSISLSSLSLSGQREIHYKELAYVIVAGDSGTVAATVNLKTSASRISSSLEEVSLFYRASDYLPERPTPASQ